MLKTVVGNLKMQCFIYAGIDTMLADSKQKSQYLWSIYVILVHQSLPDSKV